MHSGHSYSALLKQQVNDPLSLKVTTMFLTPKAIKAAFPPEPASDLAAAFKQQRQLCAWTVNSR